MCTYIFASDNDFTFLLNKREICWATFSTSCSKYGGTNLFFCVNVAGQQMMEVAVVALVLLLLHGCCSYH